MLADVQVDLQGVPNNVCTANLKGWTLTPQQPADRRKCVLLCPKSTVRQIAASVVTCGMAAGRSLAAKRSR